MQGRSNGHKTREHAASWKTGQPGGARHFDADVLNLVTQETNNALHVILSNVALMQMPGAVRTEAETESLESIRVEALALDRTLATIASLNRLQSVTAGQPRITNMDTVIPLVIERVGHMWPTRSILVENQAGQVAVLSEADYVERLLENLLLNAARFSTPVDPIEVTVRADESFAEVAVRDYGPPLPTGHIGEVFEPYFRSQWRGPELAGIGFGLAAAKRIVEFHGGTMSAGAAPGGGSVFRFALPLAGEIAGQQFDALADEQNTD